MTIFVTGTVKSASNQRSEMGMIGKLLDKDGNGIVVDDLLNMGMQALFKKRK